MVTTIYRLDEKITEKVINFYKNQFLIDDKKYQNTSTYRSLLHQELKNIYSLKDKNETGNEFIFHDIGIILETKLENNSKDFEEKLLNLGFKKEIKIKNKGYLEYFK